MDYLDIVLKGYFNPNNREHLSKYFFRKFKKAEKEYYEAPEFFNGCLRIIEEFESYLKGQLHERKKELYSMLNLAKSKTIKFSEKDNLNLTYEQQCDELITDCKQELASINLDNYMVNLSSLTKGRIACNMEYSEVLYIKEAIHDAYKKTFPPQQTKINRLKVKQIALIYFYEGIQITRENAGEIAEKHGYTAKNSGEGLFHDYSYYCSTANRKGKPTLCTPKKLKNKIELFESVVNHLSDNNKQRAIDEINILKTLFENEYQ